VPAVASDEGEESRPTRHAVATQPLERALLELVDEVAPRKGAVEIDAATDLGFDGFGMTIVEYLVLLDRVHDRWGGGGLERVWPHTVAGIAELVEQ
jgi:hypothetical protein